jgi:hypothetical protein
MLTYADVCRMGSEQGAGHTGALAPPLGCRARRHVYVYIFIYIYIFIYLSSYPYLFEYICIYIDIHIDVHIYTYIYINIYAYTDIIVYI